MMQTQAALRIRGKKLSIRQLETLIREFGTWCYNERGYAPETIKKYMSIARACNSWLEENRGHILVAAGPKDLRAFLFSRTPNALNRNNIRQALVAFGDYLVSRDIWDFNLATDLPRLPQPRSLPKALGENPATKIWKVAKTLDLMAASLVGLYLFAGGRATETRLLEWPDINLDSGEVRFQGKGRGGRSKERDVPLHPDVLAALRTWRAKTNDPRWVFPSPKLPNRPASYSYLRSLIDKVGEIAGGMYLHPHLLRHTVATAMLNAGVNIREVQDFLGHAKISTTAIYLKVRPSQLRDAVNRLDFSGNGQKTKGDNDER